MPGWKFHPICFMAFFLDLCVKFIRLFSTWKTTDTNAPFLIFALPNIEGWKVEFRRISLVMVATIPGYDPNCSSNNFQCNVLEYFPITKFPYKCFLLLWSVLSLRNLVDALPFISYKVLPLKLERFSISIDVFGEQILVLIELSRVVIF